MFLLPCGVQLLKEKNLLPRWVSRRTTWWSPWTRSCAPLRCSWQRVSARGAQGGPGTGEQAPQVVSQFSTVQYSNTVSLIVQYSTVLYLVTFSRTLGFWHIQVHAFALLDGHVFLSSCVLVFVSLLCPCCFRVVLQGLQASGARGCVKNDHVWERRVGEQDGKSQGPGQAGGERCVI